MHDQIGTQSPVGRIDARLLAEIAVLYHTGHLDDATQSHLTPSSTNAWRAKRTHEVRRLGVKMLLRLCDRLELLGE